MGVTVDYKSGNIYVGQLNNNKVLVFNGEGYFLYKFGCVEMKSPLAIAIFRDIILITQYDNTILLVYNINGEHICSFDFGYDRVMINLKVGGIAVNEYNEDIYICILSDSRIRILSECTYLTYFGSGIVNSPVDIQITKNYIVISSEERPFFHTFDFEFNVIQNIIPTDICEQRHMPTVFFIDRSGNFIICNFALNNVIIVNDKGLLIQILSKGIRWPIGVTLDGNGRILVVCNGQKLLIF